MSKQPMNSDATSPINTSTSIASTSAAEDSLVLLNLKKSHVGSNETAAALQARKRRMDRRNLANPKKQARSLSSSKSNKKELSSIDKDAVEDKKQDPAESRANLKKKSSDETRKEELLERTSALKQQQLAHEQRTKTITTVSKKQHRFNQSIRRYSPEKGSSCTMTATQLSAWRKEARRKRNRESAAKSRQKTKTRIQELEEEVHDLRTKYNHAVEQYNSLLLVHNQQQIEMQSSQSNRSQALSRKQNET